MSIVASNAPLPERYRPGCWEDVIGQEKVVSAILRLKARNALAGKAYWLSGASGTGKTTIARLLAAEIADGFSVEEIDSQWLTPARVKAIDDSLRTRGWGETGGRVIIINEAHAMSDPAIKQLLTTIEPGEIPLHAAWIFTTTSEGQQSLFGESIDAAPLLSRCLRLALARRDLAKPFAQLAKEIAEKEGLNGQPIERYVRLLQDCKNNLRAALSAIEAGEMLS